MPNNRKHSAQKFRDAIARSNELHKHYLDDPRAYRSYDRFTRWQFGYMLPFFDDLKGPPGYEEAIDFVVNDLAGVGVSERDHDIERAAPVIVRTLPTHPLETAAAAVELNAGALEINIAIWRGLLVDGELPEQITETDYCTVCREASSYEDCMRLVNLANELGATLKTLVRIPLIGGLLKSMRKPARAAGFGALQSFLEKGFVTFRQISDIDRFLEISHQRMDEIFDHIYHAPLREDSDRTAGDSDPDSPIPSGDSDPNSGDPSK
ncbi:MAG: hypothetical protein P8X94_11435 [Woeseiaceae bacterium]